MLNKTRVSSKCLQSLQASQAKSINTSSNVPTAQPAVEKKFLSDPAVTKAGQHSLKGMLNNYRTWGYRHAKTNPLKEKLAPSPLQEAIAGLEEMSTSADLKRHLDSLYCGSLGAQFMYIPDVEKQRFIAGLIEKSYSLEDEQSINLAKTMLRSAGIDKYLANKFSNLKQYSGEGAEGLLAFCELLFDLCPDNQVEDVVIGIAHRGRISFLTELLELQYDKLLHKYSGNYEFHESEEAIGDVVSHLWQSVDLPQRTGSVNVTLLPNPSHLEVVNSVALGNVRAKMKARKSSPYGEAQSKPLALLIHGDAAFLGQGCSYENAQMSKLAGFETSGSIHLITNNLIGFTAENTSAGSTFSVGDIGKMYDVPVISVNGHDVNALVKAANIAMAWRNKYNEDIIIDLQCFRVHGHNQHDEPRFTNPRLYELIDKKESLPVEFATELIDKEIVEEGFIEKIQLEQAQELSEAFSKIASYEPDKIDLLKNWSGMRQAGSTPTVWQTGYSIDDLRFIGLQSVNIPQNFSIHPTLIRAHVNKRVKMVESGQGIDWAMAETFAFGSLLMQGYNVRISGEDVPRGTFSHRHMTLYDQTAGGSYTPLNFIAEDQPGKAEAVASFLSEESVVGFEYGYSLEDPNALVLWEAQFGDFFNPAQVIYDQFVASGEAKWLTQSGFVSLLPHGYDGNGPDHTSAKLERWLQMSDSKETAQDGDNINMQIVNLSTPAQYFHALRRQMVRDFRKPLIVMSPKALLRSPAAVSELSDFGLDKTFKPVIDDTVEAKHVKRVLLCSGVHYYSLKARREELGDTTTALLRVEELCPFPATDIQTALARYPADAEVVWAQEEARNSGAWTFVNVRLREILGVEASYAGRAECAAAAVGVSKWHKKEVQQILNDAFSHLK